MTCGIYKITNKLNNKSYIGKSVNVEERLRVHTLKSEHRRFPNKTLYKALEKYGIENFSFDIIESDVPEDRLNERKRHWIQYYNTIRNGYNETAGSVYRLTKNTRKVHGRLTDAEVTQIRKYYQDCKYSARKVYSFYEDKITRSMFYAIWSGHSFPHIMPEVFTPENKYKHRKLEREIASVANRKLSLEEIQKLRQRATKESLREIWRKEYQDKMSYSGLKDAVVNHHIDEEDWYYEAI